MRFYLLFCFQLSCIFSFSQQFYLFVGTFTHKDSKGIYVYRFDAATGAAEWVSNTDSVPNPGFLTVARSGKFVYAVNASSGDVPGGISAFSFNKSTGKLSFINRQSSGGANPCYITATRRRRWVVAGNYNGGSLVAYPVRKDGSLSPYAQLIQHHGSSIRTQQDRAHVHATVFSPDERYLFCPDLGIDKVMIYRFDARARLPLQPADPPFAPAAEAGSGPRHFTFHPNGQWAYLVEELIGTVEAYKYHNGKLEPFQRISTHPEGYTGVVSSADIHVSPDGLYLYASNRGDANNLAIFSIDLSGKLSLKGHHPSGGTTPRNFMIDPTGNYLLAANQATNNIVIFRRDLQTGLLQETGRQISVPSPVCLKMVRQ